MSVNPRVSATSNGRTMILSKCALCGSKKSKFIKNQKAKGLLSSLGHKTPLSKIPKAFNIAKNTKQQYKDKYNNTKHITTKMKSIDVKDNTYLNFGKGVNDNDPKLKVGDHVRISKYKNIFVKGYTPN